MTCCVYARVYACAYACSHLRVYVCVRRECLLRVRAWCVCVRTCLRACVHMCVCLIISYSHACVPNQSLRRKRPVGASVAQDVAQYMEDAASTSAATWTSWRLIDRVSSRLDAQHDPSGTWNSVTSRRRRARLLPATGASQQGANVALAPSSSLSVLRADWSCGCVVQGSPVPRCCCFQSSKLQPALASKQHKQALTCFSRLSTASIVKTRRRTDHVPFNG